jgi:phosphoesterase RecJ-like protein
MMKDIKVSVFFRETDEGYWKVSLRSKRDFNVARIAEQFDGGGHKNAAGCTIKADLKTAKRMLLEAIRGQ